MKRLAVLALLLSSVSIVFGYPTFDQFSDATAFGGSAYLVGSPLGGTNAPNVGGQTNRNGDIWFGINTTSTPGKNFVRIANSNLTYNGFPAGFPAPSGQAAVLTNVVGPGAGLVIQKGSGGYTNVYVSYLLQVADASSLPASTTTSSLPWVTAFNDANGGNTSQGNTPASLAGRLCLRQGADNQHYQLAVANSSTTTYSFETSNGSPVTHSTNEVVFVVMQYMTNAATLTVTGACWVNPSFTSFGSATPPPPTMFVTGNGISATPTIFRFLLGNAFTTAPKTTVIGEFRIGDSWAYVTGGASITNQPSSQTVNAGTNVVMKVGVASSGTAISYQWYKGGTPLSNGGNVSGSTTAALTLTGVTQGHDGDSYTVVASTPINGSSVTSAPAVLTVTDPYIAVQPVSQNVPTGHNVTVGVTAYGTGLTYQWRANGGNLTDNGTHIVGAQTANLTLLNVSTADTAAYSVVVNNTLGGSVTSWDAVITVQDPAVTSEPASVTANYGQTATFSIVAGGTAPLNYQWQANGANLVEGAPTGAGGSVTGTKTATLTLTGVAYTDQANYTCVVTNNQGDSQLHTVTSAPASLTVNDPYITTQPPTATSIVLGSTGSIAVAAAGSPTLTYQWFKGATILANGDTGNGSTYSGSATAALTISGAASADSGTYSVTVSGPSGQVVTSSNVVLTVVTPVSITSISPATRTERVGDHLAIVASAAGTAPFTYSWSFNGSSIAGQSSSALQLVNIQTTNSGTYTVTVNNGAGTPATASATLTVLTNYMQLSSNNLVVSRIGDGAQKLNNNAGGNTIYLDQIQPDGTYVNTIQVPDAPTSAWGPQSIAGLDIGQNVMLTAVGAGADGQYENVLTRSANQQYLNFTAYNVAQGAAANPVNSSADIRGIAAVNAVGFYQLAYTNFGLYSGGNQFIRSVVSDDGLVDFWTTGAASSAGIKYTQVGVSTYATGNGIPALSGSNPGTRVVDIVNGNLVFSDSQGNVGINAFSGLPKPLGGSVPSALIVTNTGGSPNDFAGSPDLQTVYICDDRAFVDGQTAAGGIERWDSDGAGGWNLSYTLQPTGGTNGATCLTVDWSANTTWGSGVTGAILYATTAGNGNSLVKIVDTGAGSTGTVLSTAGPNQLLRGVRFGPVAVPVQITTQPANQATFVGQNFSLGGAVTGDAPFSYQWQKNGVNIPGATNATYSVTGAQQSDSGSYSFIVQNPLPSGATSQVAVVTVTAVPPQIVVPVQARVETVGDHTAFSVLVTGSAPFSYSWTHNGSTIPNATNNFVALTNIQSSDAGTYKVTIVNGNGSTSSSATLTVTPGLQQLNAGNLVVARVGEGAQPLSTSTGNTIYFDQIQTDGTYVNTIQIPDAGPNAVVAKGGAPDALTETVVTRSFNSGFLVFGGYNVSYPYTGTGGSVGYANGSSGNIRAICTLDAYGAFNVAITNVTLYNGSTQFRSACSADGITNFYTTGAGSSGNGLKWVHSGGATTAIAGGLAGTRVVDISPHGNLAFTDFGENNLTGLNAISGLPTASATSALVVSNTGSVNDFAISPDVQTVYIADDDNFTDSTGNGGIQRWDSPDGSTYVLSYTLPTGGNSLGGARCLTVDFNASGSWGPGSTGAIIYATTSEGSTNKIVKIVDNGPGSTSTVIATAGPNQIFRGLRFAPAGTTVGIISNPQNVTTGVGGTATFKVTATGGPLTYQWQLNGVNLTDGASPSGTGATISGSSSPTLTVSGVAAGDSGQNYTVVVSNPNPGGSATSSTAVLTVLSAQFGPGGGEVQMLGDHTVQLNFSGTAGSTYRVWGTTNVALKPITSTWTLLGSGTFSGGADSFVDTNAPSFQQQFYTITIP